MNWNNREIQVGDKVSIINRHNAIYNKSRNEFSTSSIMPDDIRIVSKIHTYEDKTYVEFIDVTAYLYDINCLKKMD